MKNFEELKNKELDNLFDEWLKVISTKADVKLRYSDELYKTKDLFYKENSFPGYFSADKKILFVGREAHSVGFDKTKEILEFLENNNINRSPLYRRIFYIAYGVKNAFAKFSEIPYADEIKKDMLKNKNFNFSILNLSHYVNYSGNESLDLDLVRKFIEDSELDKRNFFLEALEIFDPDIIITFNLWFKKIGEKELGSYFFDDKAFSKILESKSIDEISSVYKYNLNSKQVPLVDLAHFSTRTLKDEEGFYNPVKLALS